ncbi:MAG: 16S rRNA (guanine(527)-N(7))-methyltransferase RsmG [Candidatus Wenzhouxiangella sp. M2_3B_020]
MSGKPADDPDRIRSDLAERLPKALAAHGSALPDGAAGRIAAYLAELVRWNRAYNLTAVTDPAEMVQRHVLDSLSVRPHLEGKRIVDAGTGAGLPGIILAIAEPDRHFVLVDSNNKKIRFLRHVARSLGLDNVESVHARLESLELDPPPDEIVARALAPLPRLVEWLSPWLDRGAPLLAMKGPKVSDEVDDVPAGYSVDLQQLDRGGGDAERVLAIVRRRH